MRSLDKLGMTQITIYITNTLFYSSFIYNFIHKNENSYSKRQWYPCYRR